MATALVTGSNRGIGLELCRLLAGRGDAVVAVCRKSSPELRDLDVEIEEGVDVSDDAAVRAFARKLEGKHLDIVIHNAGILGHEALGGIDYGSVRKQLEVNALGPLRLTEALLPNLSSGSRVALVTSRMGSIGDNTSGGSYGYRMSKAALNAAGKSLALDLRDRGIAVVLLHPGYVRTDMTRQHGNIDPVEAAAGLLARIDALAVASSGEFRHQNGEELPW